MNWQRGFSWIPRRSRRTYIGHFSGFSTPNSRCDLSRRTSIIIFQPLAKILASNSQTFQVQRCLLEMTLTASFIFMALPTFRPKKLS